MHDLTIQLKMARLRIKMTQSQMAKQIGVNKITYINIENHIENFRVTNLTTFLLICQSLDDEFRARVMNEKYLLTLLED